ncbi:MAG: HAD-IA family hydrolase, partial [Rhodobacteraceae bacterium]|nr:HAD-IA family hydrolase [Paracoccaceae bacterium]
CTNKALEPTLEILDALDLRRFFGAVIGGDSLPQKKPDPAPLKATFAQIGAPLLYVGDSEVDAATA